MKRTLLILFIAFTHFMASSQNPKREVRAAWLATVTGIDWPKTTVLATQKANMIDILDSYKELGINTVYFQVRGLSDAMYKSNIAPWATNLTGTYNKAPDENFDPLQFVIEEGHKRGMEVHAWLNPYRVASTNTSYNNLPSTHPAKQAGLRVVNNTTGTHYLDPGLTSVRNHVNQIIMEIVNNYDVDGIHFDDYFYLANIGTQDDQTFAQEPRNYGANQKEDWRRNNITLLVTETNNSIKAAKPWVKFGISPSGIYRNSTNAAIGTNTSGSQHYSVQYIDSKYIMEQNLIDYLTPQVYWFIGQSGANFSIITPWWNTINTNRHITIGLAAYKVGDAGQGAFNTNVNEISQQVNMIRSSSNLKGAAYYNTTTLNANKNNFRTSLINNQYNTPALIPVMTWIDNVAPAEPTNLVTSLSSGKTKLDWTAPANTADELQKVVRYAVYRATSPNINFDTSSSLIAVLPSSAVTYTDNGVTPGAGTSYYYAVRSLDRMSNESISSNVIADPITLPVTLTNFYAKKDGNRVRVEWTTSAELNNDYFLLEKAGNDGNFVQINKEEPKIADNQGVRNYTSWDAYPNNGVNYYRLTQVDKNGNSAKPEITALNFNELIVVNAVAYPNPTKGDINFRLDNFYGKSITAKVTNLLGQIVHEEKFEINSENNDFKLNLKSNLANGHYVLSIYNTNYNKNIKLVVD